jgi:DNA-binding NarL/FixJ family response regulator
LPCCCCSAHALVRSGAEADRRGVHVEAVADALFISIKTVDRHRQSILDKPGMRDRVELTRYAIRRGLIQP